MTSFPVEALESWFLAQARSLPWRQARTPYRVWISEVMLQQTQASVVIPYFQRWMERFPTVHALASAPEEEVIKSWEGLGYYSRARYLHQNAKLLVEHYGGVFPEDPGLLAQLKGLGPYTQNALLCFAFGRRVAPVDGNVARVLSRFFGIEEVICEAKVKAQIQKLATGLLPDADPARAAEGLIELGATVCKKQPECLRCPLQSSCLAFRHQLQGVLPRKRPRQKTIRLCRQVAIIRHHDCYLVRKEEKGRVMADLYQFPYFDSESKEIKGLFERELGLVLAWEGELAPCQQTFTRYRVELIGQLFCTEERSKQGEWIAKEKLKSLPFSSGHRRLLHQLLA